MIAERAEALLAERRFYEWLDATAHHASMWPHNRTTAMRWLLDQCEVERLRELDEDPEAAAAFDQLASSFALWDQNGELEV
ncbi:hypothetical protein SAMN04487957_10570 [Halomonas shengliensis]|uniref:Uncharacterized protein n=1 Tax=Halomonas shengliensis TaxID=419597 RepID=A0A1H0ICV7_9GAMM|nr:hypothetical protein [Halomonas shengliensis]SDO29223.1 hypothetical protein SAMN04487957_10570 [Halomonas shengliensis]